jgi:hypothetical protein
MLDWVMMCLIHIEESAIQVFIDVRPSCLCVPFSKKLDNLLVRLDNRHMMHNFQCDMRKWVHEDRNDTHYCSTTVLHNCKYLLHLALITISHSFTLSSYGFPFSFS